jgi:hypothetical protein
VTWRPLLELADRWKRPRSFVLRDGELPPSRGDLLLTGEGPFGPTGVKVEGVEGRTVWFTPLPPDDVPTLGCQRWDLTDERGAHREIPG